MSNADAVVPLTDSSVYTGGVAGQNTSFHRGADPGGLITQLSQLVGRNPDGQPEPIDSIGRSIVTSPGLYGQMGTSFLYYVRGNETGTALFVNSSDGRVKKVVTFPTNVLPDTIIRVTVFFYQNASFPNKVTTIKDYEELAGFYMVNGSLSYDVNGAIQNNINPN